MDSDQITEKLVKDTLFAWRQHKPVPIDWQALDYVRGEPDWAEAFRQSVMGYIGSQVESGYKRVGSPLTLTANWKKALQEAHQLCDDELLTWSLLYSYMCDPAHPQVRQIAAVVFLDVHTINYRIRSACSRVAEYIRRQEQRAQQQIRQAIMAASLPVPEYRTLYGTQKVIEEACKALYSPDNTGFVSIQGIGGIGKTAQARELIKQLAASDYFHEIIWISARQEWFNAEGERESNADPVLTLNDILNQLAQKLRLSGTESWDQAKKIAQLSEILAITRRLIVLDNLETVEEIRHVISTLYPLAQVSRFLLTSREKVPTSNIVQSIPVPVLSQDESFALIRSEMRQHLSERFMRDEELAQIYTLVDGIPLPLKLIAAQLAQNLPLSDILAGLTPRSADTIQTESQYFADMYRFIYDRALRLLLPSTRRLLFSLNDLPPGGCPLDWIEMIAANKTLQMDTAACHRAIQELRDLSLLECEHPYQFDAVSVAHYRLHRLTATHLNNLLWTTGRAA